MRRPIPIVRAGLRACLSLRLLPCVLALAASAAAARAQTQATALPLLYPSAIAFDAQGNLYFAETANHVIREVASGILTTIAGTGVQGFSGDNGPAISAQLDSPAGLAVDASGDLYIADTHNHRVRKLTASTGVLTTVAGTGAPGFSGDNGAATSAQLDHPIALAVDSSGNLYVADTGNHRIRKVAASTGLISTVAGSGIQGFSGDNGSATLSSIDSPAGLAVDAAGNLYLADTHNHRIRKVAASTGIITTVAGTSSNNGSPQPFSGDNGPAISATLALPRGLAVDSAGNLYLADSANQRIRLISAGGTISSIAGEGTEAYAGDNAPAISASLAGPRSVALSATGLATVADTGNARIRQLDQLPAPGPDIHTIAGLGVTTPAETLTLTGPSVTAYGSGSLTATLAAPSAATGSVTLLDTTTSATLTLGAHALAADSATFPTVTLAAGNHTLLATYAGDANHSAAQSSAFALTVTPLQVTATPNPAAIVYGQPVPALAGTLTGVLAQDSGEVSAVFTTSAGPLSPAGLYPIAATLTGAAATNYAAASPSASFSIAQAPSLTTLSASASAASAGVPVTLGIQASSTTAGTPTGSVILLDGSAPLTTLTLSNTASAAYTVSSLAAGSHSLSAVYSGDGNFLPSTSAAASISVGAPADFALTATGATSQSIPSGSSATYTFSVTMQGEALSSPISLAVAGVPRGATSSMNPAYVPPGGAVTSFTLTIQTSKSALLQTPGKPTAPALPPLAALLLLSPTLAIGRRSRRFPPRLLAAACASCILFATLLSGCGNRIDTAAESSSATSYTLTVTGTATGPAGAQLEHSANVTLQVL